MTPVKSTLRAHARGGRDWAKYSDSELQVLRHLVTRVRSSATKVAWRRAMQRRTARIAGLLRSLATIVLAPTVNRTKAPGSWLVTASDVDGVDRLVLELVTRAAARTVDQLGAPIPIRVHRADLVDRFGLENLQQNGSVDVVSVEAGS
jgi:hypothetical protein